MKNKFNYFFKELCKLTTENPAKEKLKNVFEVKPITSKLANLIRFPVAVFYASTYIVPTHNKMYCTNNVHGSF